MTTKQTLILAATLLVSLATSAPSFAWPSVNEVVNTVTDAAQDAGQAASNAVSGATSQPAPSGGSVSAGGQADVPNPFGVASQIGNGIRNQAENAYNQFENAPGVSVGGSGSISVNGRTIGGGGTINVNNPTRDIRHGAQDLYNRGRDAYSNLENQPGITIGGGAEIDVNGRKYGGHTNVDVQNPLRGMREDAREGGRVVRRGWNELVNAPGVSVGGRVDGRYGRGGADANVGIGIQPYTGRTPRARAFGF